MNVQGQSGETGCAQYLPSTWELHAKAILGYVPKRTNTNERYVLTKMVAKYLADGKTEKEIALIHNQGHAGPCRRGTNSHNVKYDSCHYRDAVYAIYKAKQ